MKLLTKLVIAALAALLPALAGASVTYQVTTPQYSTASAPYTTAMGIAGSFTLPAAIPPSRTNYQVTGITSFSFSDGVNSYINSNSAVALWVTTDGAGNVALGVNDWLSLNSNDEFKSVSVYSTYGTANNYDPVTHVMGSGSFNGSTSITQAQTQYTIGGTITGLVGSGLVLTDAAAGTVAPSAPATSFAFPNSVNAGTAYNVTVQSQPTGQTCTVSNGSGTANANVTNVAVTCTSTTYTIGGTVSGLASGKTVVLQNNGGDNKTVSANGAFTFATAVNAGGAYAVTILTQPTGQTCTVSNGSGTANANVTNVAVTCTSTTYTIGGTVTGLTSGKTVVLQNNGGDNKTVSADGAFTFTTPVNAGSAYAVTVLTQPAGQACTVSNGSGTASANVTNVSVACVSGYTLSYSTNGHDGTAPASEFRTAGTSAAVANGGAITWNAHPARYWTTNADGTGTRYDFGSSLVMPAANLTLYAQWNTVSARTAVGMAFFDVLSWRLGLSAVDSLGSEAASGTPAKHCLILSVFICNFDPITLTLPVSPNSPVTSNMVTSNMACKYRDVASPQVPVTVPWQYFPIAGFYNLALPGSTTVGWTAPDSLDRSYANNVDCDTGMWVIIACTTNDSTVTLCALLNVPQNGTSKTVTAQSADPATSQQASLISTRSAPASGGPITYIANCTSPDGGAPVSGSSGTNTMTLSGATPGKRYQCSFSATDGSYDSPAVSNDNGSIVIAVPTNPTKVVAAPGQGSITVSFGSSTGTGPVEYAASCTSSDGGASGVAVGTGSPLVVSGLTLGKSYTCTVTARDTNGLSQSITNVNGPVVPSSAVAAAIPVLSEWPQLLLMILLIGMVGWHYRRAWR